MHDLWRTEPRGISSAEVNGLRLIVQAPKEVGGLVGFTVLRQDDLGRTEFLIGSGNEASVRAAMTAAERMAERYTGL